MKINSKGQSLIEVLAGLAMAVLIVAALVNMVTASLRSSQYAKTTSQATKYAQEAIEWLRSERDSAATWSDFKSNVLGDSEVESKTWCLKNVSEGLPINFGSCAVDGFVCYGDCLPAETTIFKRELTIVTNTDSDSRINVNVKVFWTDQALAEHSSELKTILSDTGKWR